MKNKLLGLLTCACALAFLESCSEDEGMNGGLDLTADVIIINEGNFRSADGSLSTFNSSTAQASFSVFASVNGFPLAATVQNAIVEGGHIYAVTNEADKVEVIASSDFQSVATVRQGFNSPYSVAIIGDKAYVTNWGELNATWEWEHSFISILDLTNYAVIDSIQVSELPQHVLAVGNEFYVSNVGSNTLSIYNSTTDEWVTDIVVSSGPDKMVLDADGDVWVLCTSGNLVEVDPTTQTVKQTLSNISASGFNEKMVIDEAGENLYFLSAGTAPDYEKEVYTVDVTGATPQPVKLTSGKNFYGIGVSPDGELYVADNKAFQGVGEVFIYDQDGMKINSFISGRAPNGFIFR